LDLAAPTADVTGASIWQFRCDREHVMSTGNRAVTARADEIPTSTGREMPRSSVAAHPRPGAKVTSRLPSRGSAAAHLLSFKLSARATNVLKLLAPEIIGTMPPRGHWTPPDALLRQITVKTLMTARNCGPRTLAEIVTWAQRNGVTIQPLCHAGKSLPQTWRELDAKFAAGNAVTAEIVEALERSVRRKNTRIPIAVQKALLATLSTCE
jgi:hypothetical protein